MGFPNALWRNRIAAPEAAQRTLGWDQAFPLAGVRGWIHLFVLLQFLDLITTLVGFRMGAAEASPLIRLMMHAGPAAGVVLSKVAALGLCLISISTGRHRLIRWIAYWYIGLVIWNLGVILRASGRI